MSPVFTVDSSASYEPDQSQHSLLRSSSKEVPNVSQSAVISDGTDSIYKSTTIVVEEEGGIINRNKCPSCTLL